MVHDSKSVMLQLLSRYWENTASLLAKGYIPYLMYFIVFIKF